MNKILSIAFIAILLISCGTTKQTITNKTKFITATIDIDNIVNDKVNVEVIPNSIVNGNEIVYHLPKIIPGTYSISDYGKFISDFKAFDSKGNELTVEVLDINSWKIKEATKLSKISYWVEDTFDSEITNKIYLMSGTSIDEDKCFFLNLFGFVGYFDGQENSPYNVKVKHPAHLSETSSLEVLKSNLDNTEDVFIAQNYDVVADNPLMYTKGNTVTFDEGGVEVTLTIFSPTGKHSVDDFKPALQRMVKAQTNFLNDFKFSKEYNILVYLTPKGFDGSGLGGALEHMTSTTVVMEEETAKEDLIDSMINHVIAHEFFHIVTPLQVHSNEIQHFNFNDPDMSKHLWMYEGITEYFASLFQINQDLINEDQFLDIINDKIIKSKYMDDSMSFIEMSENILNEPYADNYGNVYMKGALMGMCIDILLKEGSSGTYGIRNLMLELSKKYGITKPFDDDTIIDEIKNIVQNQNVSDFFDKHIINGAEIDYDTYFDKVGIARTTKQKESYYFLNNSYEPFFYFNGKNFKFRDNLNTGLEKLGVKSEDVISKINNVALTSQNVQEIMLESLNWKKGKEISIVVERNGQLLTLSGKTIQPMSLIDGYGIKEANGPKAELRKAWLKGL